MGEQLFLERFVWFDNEARRERYPNAFKLADHFEVSTKTAQRSIDCFRDRLLAPLEYEVSRKGYYYTDPTFQLPVLKISPEELLALLISKKLISEASAGSLADELGHISRRLGSLLAANLPGRAHPKDAFSFRWKSVNPTDPLIFRIVTTTLLLGKLLTFCYYSPHHERLQHEDRGAAPHGQLHGEPASDRLLPAPERLAGFCPGEDVAL